LNDPPYSTDGDRIRIRIRVTPRSRKTAVVGIQETGDGGSAVGIRLNSPPVDGAANRALVDFLASELGLPRSAVKLVAGEKSRLKTLLLDGADAPLVSDWIEAASAR
jgi:uncharacterized protein (TIGR00251 family)